MVTKTKKKTQKSLQKNKPPLTKEELLQDIELSILAQLKDNLLPLAFAVYKGEMLQSEDKGLRHKAATAIIGTLERLNGLSGVPDTKTSPLINLNFPDGFLEKTFTGVADLVQEGDKEDEPRKIKSTTEIADDPEDYL